MLLQVHFNTQVQFHSHESVCHYLKNLVIRQIVFHMGLTQIQKICNLIISVKPFPRCRYHYVPSFRIGFDDLFRLCQLNSVSD